MKFKKPVFIVGTCIAPWVGYLLNNSLEFISRYDLKVYWTNRSQQYMDDLAISDEELNSAAAVIHHTPGWADWGNDGAYEALIARIPSHVRRVSFPYPVFLPLWPFHRGDHRNDDPNRRRLADGSLIHLPYGDAIVLGLLRDGLSTSAVVERYMKMDLAEMIDLDALFDKTIEIQQEKERHTDVKILDFVASNFRSSRVFNSMNHVSNASLIFMANQMLRFLELPSLAAGLHEQVRELLMPQVPIHPSVRKHFNVTWASDETRYAVNQYQMLTFEEYVYYYAS